MNKCIACKHFEKKDENFGICEMIDAEEWDIELDERITSINFSCKEFESKGD